MARSVICFQRKLLHKCPTVSGMVKCGSDVYVMPSVRITSSLASIQGYLTYKKTQPPRTLP